METVDYLKLKKKEDKSPVEWELLKTEAILRTVSEMVTAADKHEEDPQYYIDSIREYLRENRY